MPRLLSASDLMSGAQFKALARRKMHPGAVQLRKDGPPGFVAISERALRFTISTAQVDRSMDVVQLDGWDLTAYRSNPVVLWQHDRDALPIGRGVDLAFEDGALKASVEFVPFDTPEVGPRAEAIMRLCQGGFLNATSVGFRPTEYEIAEDRDDGESWFPPLNFIKHELLEWSIVNVPCNAGCLGDHPEVSEPGPTGINLIDALDPQRSAREAAEKAQQDEVLRLHDAAARARRLHKMALTLTF